MLPWSERERAAARAFLVKALDFAPLLGLPEVRAVSLLVMPVNSSPLARQAFWVKVPGFGIGG